MQITTISLRKSLNKAYLKVKPNRTQIETFNNNLGYELDVFSNRASDEIVNKLTSVSDKLDNLVLIKAGLQAYESGKGNPRQSPDDVTKRIYDFKYKFDNSTYEYLEGKDVGRYFVRWSGTYLRYGEHLAAPRTFDIFKGRKIIIREISGKYPQSIIGTYTGDIFLFNRSNIAILEKEGTNVNLKYVLGVLNSKLMSYYFIKKTAKSVRQMFPKLILEDLRKFPLKNCSIEKQKPIISLVKQILNTKKVDINTETTFLESEIDCLVYELYGLTEEEIRIVEGG